MDQFSRHLLQMQLKQQLGSSPPTVVQTKESDAGTNGLPALASSRRALDPHGGASGFPMHG